MVRDTAALLNHAISAGQRVLFEGAQGTLLDVDHGTYPFVTLPAPRPVAHPPARVCRPCAWAA